MSLAVSEPAKCARFDTEAMVNQIYLTLPPDNPVFSVLRDLIIIHGVASENKFSDWFRPNGGTSWMAKKRTSLEPEPYGLVANS